MPATGSSEPSNSMSTASFVIRCLVYVMCFAISFYAMGSVNYEKLLKPGHTAQAQILYWLIVIALAYLVGQFVISLM